MTDLHDLVTSLAELMETETAALLAGARCPDHDSLVAAKLKLTGQLEAVLAGQARTGTLAPSDGDALAAALDRLAAAASANAAILRRKIDLSDELLATVAAEVQRLSGARSATYGQQGRIASLDLPAPLSVNRAF